MNHILLQVIDVLSKLAGLWVNAKKEIMYSQASQITFICPMIFSYFPLDTQVETSKYVCFGCLPRTKMSCCQLSRIQTLYPIFKSVYLCTCHPLLAPQRRRVTLSKCPSELFIVQRKGNVRPNFAQRPKISTYSKISLSAEREENLFRSFTTQRVGSFADRRYWMAWHAATHSF